MASPFTGTIALLEQGEILAVAIIPDEYGPA
jgi:hypothetical protein